MTDEYAVAVCDACGKPLVVGAWPFCPHGTTGAASVIGDDIPGGEWQENGFREPRKFYSKKKRERALAERGLEIRVRHTPIPGTDKSPHTTDWSKGSMDPYTLEAARALVERVTSTPSTTTNDEGWPVTFSIRDLP